MNNLQYQEQTDTRTQNGTRNGREQVNFNCYDETTAPLSFNNKLQITLHWNFSLELELELETQFTIVFTNSIKNRLLYFFFKWI